ncbi:MAG: hypothetical protein K2G48_01390, partial [Malacoplasma sp.]|nr:hypothetical protein [Malacoplasma sp.]
MSGQDSISMTKEQLETLGLDTFKTFEFSPLNWVVIALYLGGILVMGLFFQFQRKKHNLQSSSQEYFKASGSVPGWAVGLSVFATSLSAITFISVPETTFTSDWAVVIGAMIIPCCAPFIIRYIIPFYRQLQSSTAYGYLEKRYNHACQMLVSIFYIFYHTIRVGVVTYLPTIVISSVLPEANPYLIAFIIAAIAVFSAVWGGTKGVIWADVVQAIFLTAGILVLCFFGMGIIGGIPNADNSNVNGINAGENSFATTANFAFDSGKYFAANKWVISFSQVGIPLILMTYLVSVLYSMVCGHDIVQRYQSSKRLSETKKAIYLNSCMFLLSFFLFYGFGTIIYQIFTSPYSLGSDSGFGVAYFPDANNMPILPNTAEGVAQLPFTKDGWTSPQGIISNFDNFEGVNNEFINQIKIKLIDNKGNPLIDEHGQEIVNSYGLIKTTATVPYFMVTTLPIGVSGIVIAAVMAAAQGTNGAGMTSGAEVFVKDILLPHKPNLSEKSQVVWGKIVSLSMGIVGYGFTAILIAGQVNQVYIFFNSLQGSFGAPVLAAFLMGMFGTYIKKNSMTWALYLGHVFAIVIFIFGDGTIAKWIGWNNDTSYYSSQWDGPFTFAFVVLFAWIYQFFENLYKYKNGFFVDKKVIEQFENYSWAYMSKESYLISEVEWSVSMDEKAYAKYVKSHYADKKNSKDPLELEKHLSSYKEFLQLTSYERYVMNRSSCNKWRTLIFKKPILEENEFKKYRLDYLTRE